MVAANELKRRTMILIEGDPYLVLEVLIAPPAARGASTLVRTKVRQLLTGAVQDRSFKAGEKFVEADVDTVEAHFLYKDGDTFYFMEEKSFETLELSRTMVADAAGYLTEDLGVKIMKYNAAPAALELPVFVNMEVIETEPPAPKAGSAGAGTKNATLAGGRVVRVPQYISVGETVRVNTETGEVAGRA